MNQEQTVLAIFCIFLNAIFIYWLIENQKIMKDYKKGFMDGYTTYDTSEGYGSRDQWKSRFYFRMTGEEAAEIIEEARKGSPWDILGLKQGATKPEIKKAYRILSMKWHPDKNSNPEAAAMFRDIHAAYTILFNL